MTNRSTFELERSGQRALHRSTHDDHEPGLEKIRWGRLLGGTALTLYGIARRKGWADLVVAGVGATLAYGGLKQSPLMGNSLKRLALHTATTGSVDVATTMTVERPADEVYEFWRNLENLPRFMRHLAAVDEISPGLSRWVARLPTGITLEWQAKILEEKPGELIAWQSVQGSDIFNEGYVTFRSVFNGQGTEIHARITYHPPAGEVGARIAGFFEELQARYLREDLRSFKRLIETGELPTTQGQPSARRSQGNGRIDRMIH